LLALAQLRADDVPDLPRPDGVDLLQVLWCPFEHSLEPLTGPAVRQIWRRQEESPTFCSTPSGEVGDEGYIPTPCRLHPEQIVEYPFPQELPQDLQERLDGWEHDSEDLVLARAGRSAATPRGT